MKVDFQRWRDTPAINGRIATEKDFESGIAVFYQSGPAEPANIATLPALAKYQGGDGSINDVIVVQLEKQVGGITVCGAYYRDGSALVCTLSEITLIL